MRKFNFKTDQKSNEFCENIISEMMDLFKIADEEALGRINHCWRGIEFTGEDYVYYHEEEYHWAHEIYYGKDSVWWQKPEGLKPLPYP